MRCPVCDEVLRALDLPKVLESQLAYCEACKEYAQILPDGVSVPLGSFLKRVAAGDERARVAVSTPTPSSVHSFLDTLGAFNRTYSYERAVLEGALLGLLAQAENRADTAIARFAKFEFVDDDAVQGMKALRELREFISTMPSRNRGVPDNGSDPK